MQNIYEAPIDDTPIYSVVLVVVVCWVHIMVCLAQLKLIKKASLFHKFQLCPDKPLLKTATEI
jgi:hypothetical protein